MSICITDSLLPKISKVEPQKAFNLIFIVAKISQSALQALREGHFHQFDAPVGDNSCKIRAARQIFIIERAQTDPLFAQEIDRVFKQFMDIQMKIPELQKRSVLQKDVSLSAFVTQQQLNLTIDPQIVFLIQSHFLFSFKKPTSYDETNPVFLQKIAPLSKSTAKDWIHTIKERLSQASVQFIQQEVNSIEGPRKSILSKMVRNPFLKIYEKRVVAPNFHCMEIIFQRLIDQNYFIIFKTAEQATLFHPQKTKLSLRDLERPALIIQGRELAAYDFTNPFPSLLTSAAQDPQYLDGKRVEPIPFNLEDEEVRAEEAKFFKLQAETKAFQIEHIFCDRIGNHSVP